MMRFLLRVFTLVVFWELFSDSRRNRKRRERLLVERATERERTRLNRKARADERRQKKEEKRMARRERWNQLKGGPRNVELKRRLAGDRSLERRMQQSLELRLLQAALEHEARLTVTQGVTATAESFQAVEACLGNMVSKGYVDVDNHPESGAVVYVFAEAAPKTPLFRQRRNAIERAIRKDRKRQGETATRPVRLSTLLLHEARERDGRPTVTQGVLATGESYEAVEACLEGMVDDRYVGVDNDPRSPVVAYVFAEMITEMSDRDSEPRSSQVRAAAQALVGLIGRFRIRWRDRRLPPGKSRRG